LKHQLHHVIKTHSSERIFPFAIKVGNELRMKHANYKVEFYYRLEQSP